MNLPAAPSGTLDSLEEVVSVCDRFEAAWRAGNRPAIDTYLPDGPTDLRQAVLRELVVIELELRAVAGEAPDPAEYHRRFPELVDAPTVEWKGASRGDDTPARSVGPAAGDVLGPYELIKAIGSGGMGVVYKARHRVTGGVVAVKVIRPEVFDDDPDVRAEALRRFTEEFRSQAAVQHPHAVPIYDVGEAVGRPFYVMPYIAGSSLARAVRERPLAVRSAAEAIAAVADAVEAAHQAGVLHRDIKPHNVLLDHIGRAYLADFGLAKRLEAFRSRADPTAPMIGTLPYAAPEQVRGTAGLDRRADVYALGATLYAALTCRPPFQAATTEETLRQVLTADPAPPRVLNSGVPRDLEMVCLKCLQKDRRDRYPSAADLAADLRRFLEGKPVLARPLPVWRRTGRWIGRHPRATTVAAAVLVCVAILAGALVWQRDRDRAARVEATVAALRQGDDSRARELIAVLTRDPHLAERYLTDAWRSAKPDSPERVRLAAALVAIAPGDGSIEAAQYLESRIPQAGPHALRLIRDALDRQADELRPGLWQTFADQDADVGHRFRAAALLAGWDPRDDRWPGLADDVTRHLLGENPDLVAAWVDLFRPVGAPLRDQLLARLHDRSQGPEARLAAAVLAEWLSDPADLPLIVELVETADPTQFTSLWPRLRDRREAAQVALRGRLAKADRTTDAPRRANLAAALLRLDPADGTAWDRLRPGDPADPAPALLLHRLAPLEIGPNDLARRLESATDPELRQALVLALGEVSDRSPRALRDHADRLRQLYQTDPDPGVHAAADWVLRTRGVELPDLTAVPTRKGKPYWFVTSSGLTMTAFPGPVQVTPTRGSTRTLPPYVLASRETTLGEYRRFQPDYRPADRQKTLSRDADSEAVSAVSFWEAARYCNFLSRLEGFRDEDLCYDEQAERVVPRPDFLSRRGYRLPTEAEWEYGCRGPRPARRYFGDSDDLVPKYVWHRATALSYAMPVGQLKPNRFGLFDMLGNVAEWCHREGGPGPAGVQVLRGQGAHHAASVINAEYRNEVTPFWQTGPTGFRVARTLPDAANLPLSSEVGP